MCPVGLGSLDKETGAQRGYVSYLSHTTEMGLSSSVSESTAQAWNQHALLPTTNLPNLEKGFSVTKLWEIA